MNDSRPKEHPTIVQVAVPRPLRTTFSYALASDADLTASIGSRVRVPFGSSSVIGVVVGLETNVAGIALKEIDEILDPEPLLGADLIDLARWSADYYHHPIGDVLATMLPSLARRGDPAVVRAKPIWRARTGDLEALARAPRQQETYALLQALGAVRDAELAVYGLERRHVRALAEKDLAYTTNEQPRLHRGQTSITTTLEQRVAIEQIVGALGKPETVLLEGVTGSGKTEVYLRVIEEVVDRGQQALVLVPEISLTPQTASRFLTRFGSAGTYHSAAADRDRFDTWLECAAGVQRILVGTRSAVFTPFKNLGIIIVDEEHDSSFKQGEGFRYSARDLAVKRGFDLSIPVVLGSATPAIETITNVDRGRYRRARLTHRPGGAAMPRFEIVDIRGLQLDRGLSEPVVNAIERHLGSGAQVLVFINRRGYAPVLFCPQCRWQARCRNCDSRMTVHSRPRQLRCHLCDAVRPIPAECPECHGELINLGAGTQRIEEALTERFDVPLYRIDRDTTRSTSRLEANLNAIREGKPLILVGTQMLAKGHHLPGVTLVVVIDADQGFLSADYRAPERTAQLITQVAGRAGRAERPGEVWVQTLDPDNENLVALMADGYAGFAAREAIHRREAQMPPFGFMALIRADALEPEGPRRFLAELRRSPAVAGVSIAGPVPAPIPRRANRYRFQLMATAEKRAALHRFLRSIETIDSPRNIRFSIDVDPLDTF